MLSPVLTGLRVSSLPLWLTWFWFTNRSLLQLPLSAGEHSTGEPSTFHEFSHDWIIEPSELSYQWRLTNALSFITRCELKRGHYIQRFTYYSVILCSSVATKYLSISQQRSVSHAMKTFSFRIHGNVFRNQLLPKNQCLRGDTSIFTSVFVVAETCLQNRCIAMTIFATT
jgi:hypothetical protein